MHTHTHTHTHTHAHVDIVELMQHLCGMHVCMCLLGGGVGGGVYFVFNNMMEGPRGERGQEG